VDGSFIWLDNYTNLLHNNIFKRAAFNTFKFTAICLPLNMLLSLGLAMLLNKSAYLRGMLRIGFVAPLVVSVASIVLIFQVVFHLTAR
jgi:multiple sugar transport system permease protein